MPCVREQSGGVVLGTDHVKTLVLLCGPRVHNSIRVVGPTYKVDDVDWCAPLFHCAQYATDGIPPVGISECGDGCAVHVEQVRGRAASNCIRLRRRLFA